MKRSLLSLALALLLVLTPLVATAQATESGGLVMPIVENPITLTAFCDFDPKASATIKSYAEQAAFEALEAKTNVHIEFIHPPAGQSNEKFNLMVATGEYTDLIWRGWWAYPGGPDKAIDDGVIIDLKPYVAENAPNMNSIWNGTSKWNNEFTVGPQIKKDMMTDTGRMYYFTFLRVNNWIRHTEGLFLRGDWLDKLALKAPVTLDDWYTTLTAIKSGDPNGNGTADEIPFVATDLGSIRRFLPAYGVLSGEYLAADGTIKFGPAQPEYKEWVARMAKWYAEGLIDPDFAATDGKAFNAKITGHEAGAFGGYLAGGMSTFMGLMQADPTFRLVGAPWPKLTADGISYNPSGIAQRATEAGGFAVSTTNKYPKESVQWLDYLYSEEGHYLINFGPEGLAYDMVDGKPVLKDFILNDPSLSPVQALSKYGQCPIWFSYIQDPDGFTQILKYPGVRETADLFADSSKELVLPPLTYNIDESTERSTYLNEINTYVNENVMAWILGTKTMDDYDTVMAKLNDMGLARVIETTEASMVRYQNRKID